MKHSVKKKTSSLFFFKLYGKAVPAPLHVYLALGTHIQKVLDKIGISEERLKQFVVEHSVKQRTNTSAMKKSQHFAFTGPELNTLLDKTDVLLKLATPGVDTTAARQWFAKWQKLVYTSVILLLRFMSAD